MRLRFYNSYISLVVFVGLIIFVPYKVSLFAFKVSDIWLILCLSLQYAYGSKIKIDFQKKTFIKYFGVWMGMLAIIATVFQAWQDLTPLDPIFASEFYRFFRYFLIYEVVKNIVLKSSERHFEKFFQLYSLLGALVVLISFFEFYSFAIFKGIILDFYYVIPDQTFDENFEEFQRLLGVLGNSNSTAIYLTSTLVYPAFTLVLQNKKFFNRIFSFIYVLIASYVIVVMTSSRTSIIICIFLLLLISILSFIKIKNLARFAMFISISVIIGLFLYYEYGSKVLISDRVMFLFEGKSTTGENVGFIESMGRNELWHDRFVTFSNRAHPVAFITGMGYTKVYKNYSDNGLLSSFINGGLIGLILRLLLYYLVIRYCFWRSIYVYKKVNQNYFSLLSGVIALILIFWELSADMVEHIKIGQIFYLFFCFSFILNVKYTHLNKQRVFVKKSVSYT